MCGIIADLYECIKLKKIVIIFLQLIEHSRDYSVCYIYKTSRNKWQWNFSYVKGKKILSTLTCLYRFLSREEKNTITVYLLYTYITYVLELSVL